LANNAVFNARQEKSRRQFLVRKDFLNKLILDLDHVVLYYDKYVSGTDLYPHMPILRPHAARFHERRISGVTFTSAHLNGNVYMRVGVARALSDSSDFGLLWERSLEKCEIPWLGR